ncbi:MAG: FKBP-type peptidyl-prolyl cis-trans isomerase [Thermoplasmatota archaeon]
MADLAIKAVAFLVFVALVGGATYAAYGAIGSTGTVPRGIVVEPVRAEVGAAPGDDVALGFDVKNGGDATERVTLSVLDAAGMDAGATTRFLIAAGDGSGGFLTLHVPLGVPPGPRVVTVLATTEQAPVKRSTTTVTLDILPGTEPIVRAGDTATVEYVGWLSDGTIFGSDIATYIDSAIPKATAFRGTPGNFSVDTNLSNPASRTVPGFTEGIIGMHKGSTRSFVLTPDQAFGNATLEENRNRVDHALRVVELPRAPLNVSVSVFGQHINDTKQGDPASFKANSTFIFDQPPNRWTFRILCINGVSAPTFKGTCDANTVTYIPDPPLGDAFHVHRGVNLTSLVTAKNETTLTFTAEDPAPLNGTFTFYDYWPGASKLIAKNATALTIENDPAVGTEFTDSSSGSPVAYSVARLDAEHVVLSRANTQPLAGQTLYFAVTVLDVVSQV